MTTDPWRPPDWHTTIQELRPLPPRVRLWRPDDTAAAVLTALVLVVLGGPAGLVWSAVSSRVDVQAVLDGGSENAFDVQFAADAHYLVVMAVAGLLTGSVAAVLGRHRGPGVAIGAGVGGLLAALVAARVGHLAQHADVLADIKRYDLAPTALALIDFKLRSFGAALVWPVAALTVIGAGSVARLVEPGDRDLPALAVAPATPGLPAIAALPYPSEQPLQPYPPDRRPPPPGQPYPPA